MIRKIFFALLILVFISLTSIYLIIPPVIQKSNELIINTTENHAFSFLTNKKGWKRWWPEKKDTSSNSFKYNKSLYTLKKFSNSGVSLIINHDNDGLNSQITFIGSDKERVKVVWTIVEETSVNPLKRLQQYLFTDDIANDTKELLAYLKGFLEDDRNIYHIDIKLTKVKDSLILTTKTILTSYPENTEIYKNIAMLRQLAIQQQAVELDAPMVNVHQTGVHDFELMVGIPVNKRLKTGNGAFINKMVLGNILVAEVKGGENTVRSAVQQLENYRKDYNLVSPAMPYESFVTERPSVKDTSKWITKLYYPIF